MEQVRGIARPAAGEGPTDGELLGRFVTGRDEAAFAELVRRHGAMVLGVCRRVLDNAEDIEDAFQATFMVLVRKADSIRQRDSAASWLYGVALRVARRARAAMNRRRHHERRAAAPEAVVAPEEKWRELRPVLDDAVDRLPEKFRVLVVLCYLEGKTYDEAARLLELAKGTVSTRLTQARVMLRRLLRRRGIALPVALLAVLMEQNAAPATVPGHLPGSALQAARVAAGWGGTVAPHVAELAAAGLGGLRWVTWATIALLGFASLIAVTAAFLWPRSDQPGNQAGVGESGQAWQMAGFLSSDHPPPAHWPTFSPDETALATQGGDGAVWLWDPATRKQKTRLAPANRDFGLFIGFGANSRTVVTATSGNVQVWDADTAKETQMPGSYLAKVSPDGKSMVTVGPDGTVYRIDLAGDQPRSIARLASAGGLAFSPDGTTLAMGSGDGTVELYDWTTLKQRSRLPGNAMQTLELAFSPDGTILAARYGNTDRSGALKTAEVRFWQVATGQEKGLPRHMADAMAFAPDGQTFVTTEPDGAMNCWDPATTDRRYRIPPIIGSRLFRIVFSPDGKTVLSPGLGLRGSVNLRDVATGQIVAVLSGHFGPVVDGCFSADGQTLVTTTSGGVGEIRQRQAEVRIWKRIR